MTQRSNAPELPSPGRSYVEEKLDRLHEGARRIPALYRLAVISRILLALAFIPTGMVKLLGQRFTLMGPDTPVGYFFEAMYQTGFYWNFLGLSQVLAGVLLLIPWTATLGAVVTFPLVLNIFLITLSVGFRGTPFITGGMLLAATFLVCWDYHRLKAILWPGVAPSPAAVSRPASARMGRLEKAGYALGTVCGLGVLGAVRSLLPREVVLPLLAGGGVAVLMVVAAWIGSFVRGARPSRSGGETRSI